MPPVRKPSSQTSKRVVAIHQRPSSSRTNLMVLSQWRSPTEFLLHTPGAALLKSVPGLGESLIESKTLVPESDWEEQ